MTGVYECPISLEAVTDPVCTSVGSVYQRDALAAWLAVATSSQAAVGSLALADPVTGAPLSFVDMPGQPRQWWWPIRPSLFRSYAARGAVSSDLRAHLVQDIVVPTAALAKFPVMQGAPWRSVLHLLRAASACEDPAEFFRLITQVTAVAQSDRSGLPNDGLAAFFADAPEGRALAQKLTRAGHPWTPCQHALTRLLWRPNDSTGLLGALQSGFCYYGNFGDPMGPEPLLHLICSNRGWPPSTFA